LRTITIYRALKPVETDEGGDYFKRSMIGIKGTQTAGADLVAKNGMQVITQA
jgi:hypothetical protein